MPISSDHSELSGWLYTRLLRHEESIADLLEKLASGEIGTGGAGDSQGLADHNATYEEVHQDQISKNRNSISRIDSEQEVQDQRLYDLENVGELEIFDFDDDFYKTSNGIFMGSALGSEILNGPFTPDPATTYVIWVDVRSTDEEWRNDIAVRVDE